MRKAYLLAVLAVCCHAGMGAALEAPRVIELTDGSIPAIRIEWSPDGQTIAFTSRDGVYIIRAEEGARPVRITDLPIRHFKWISNEELVGRYVEKISKRPPVRAGKIYKLHISKGPVLIDEGYPLPRPFVTTAGRVWYDSAGISVTQKTANQLKAAMPNQEFRLVNHYPQSWSQDGPIHDDTDLWLENITGDVKKRITSGMQFTEARLVTNNTHIVGKVVNGYLLVLTYDGRIVARVDKLEERPKENRFAIMANPDLSSDGNYLVFARGWEDDTEKGPTGSDIYLYDIRDGNEMRVTHKPTNMHAHPRFNKHGNKVACLASGKLVLILFK